MFNSMIQWFVECYHYWGFVFNRLVTKTYKILSSELLTAIYQTLKMTVVSAPLAFIIGLPIGLLLYCTARDNLFPNMVFNRLLGLLVDILRAIPFIILALSFMPLNELIVGARTGINAFIVVLVVSAAPFFARLAEISFRGVDKGLVEALRAMGASRFQIVRDVLIPEALPSLVAGATVMVISIISATALAGYLGAGGLGDLAIRFGYQRYYVEIMIAVIIVLVIFNLVVQWFGDRLAKKLDHHNA